MADRLTNEIARQWRRTQQELEAIRRGMDRIAVQVRAEVAASTPIYADIASLPTGALGMAATVEDDGSGNPALLWHDGTDWIQVTP